MAALDARSLLTHETALSPDALTPPRGRHRQNGGRLQIGMVGAIRSERRAASDRNRWAAYVRIRTVLRERAEAADQRADRAEQALAGERSRADVLRERLDVQAAELTTARVGQEQAETAAAADRAARGQAEVEAKQLREAEAARQSLGRWARIRAAWRGE